MSVLSRPEFHNEEAAFAHLEHILWGSEPVCPHCSGVERITKVKANPAKRIRMGLWRCGQCKGQFTVKVGTVFEHARIPLHKTLQAVYLMVSSKKGISSHQLSRVLEIQYKSAWFLAHRIREATRDGSLAPFGTTGGRAEVDKTYIGREADVKAPKVSGSAHKNRIVAPLDRNTGRARSMPANGLAKDEVAQTVSANLAKEAKLTTDACR